MIPYPIWHAVVSCHVGEGSSIRPANQPVHKGRHNKIAMQLCYFSLHIFSMSFVNRQTCFILLYQQITIIECQPNGFNGTCDAYWRQEGTY
jgi:hypothetical protein